ncbi:hypothetical protein [Comamonas aquatica]|uniref:hypothetical protein n=1 Tax=Comamonas aquatica TaxID=225991 RepID=UPI0021B0FEFE|nr:hypothetical protein [Comamonas aquatica]
MNFLLVKKTRAAPRRRTKKKHATREVDAKASPGRMFVLWDQTLNRKSVGMHRTVSA